MDVVQSHSPRLRPLGSLLRREGLVLLSRSLSAALRRQRSRGGCGLYRHPCRAAPSLGACWTSVRRRPRHMGQLCGCKHRSSLKPRRRWSLEARSSNLRQITVKPFPAEEGLTFQSLQDNRATIDNIRLWDWQPLMNTYAQLQEIRTYYKFHDVDVDRYELDGSYQQVMLSARELEPALLPPNAQTWVNLHVLFTHGNGVVMSPVTGVSRRAADPLLA